MSVNGVSANVNNFIDLDGLSLGGAMLSVPTGGLGNDTGELRMTGVPITQFIIGGQELYIDHICEYDEQTPPSNCPITGYLAHDNGHAAGIDEPGIGDMDGSNDSDRGINTTPGGFHFLEALPSENQPGGLAIEFQPMWHSTPQATPPREEQARPWPSTTHPRLW